jgi:hypothetical protein
VNGEIINHGTGQHLWEIFGEFLEIFTRVSIVNKSTKKEIGLLGVFSKF